MSERKMMTLGDVLLNDEMMEEAKRMFEEGYTPAGIAQQVIEPNIGAINQRLGQENDPMYLAYVVEYAFTKAGLKRSKR